MKTIVLLIYLWKMKVATPEGNGDDSKNFHIAQKKNIFFMLKMFWTFSGCICIYNNNKAFIKKFQNMKAYIHTFISKSNIQNLIQISRLTKITH